MRSRRGSIELPVPLADFAEIQCFAIPEPREQRLGRQGRQYLGAPLGGPQRRRKIRQGKGAALPVQSTPTVMWQDFPFGQPPEAAGPGLPSPDQISSSGEPGASFLHETDGARGFPRHFGGITFHEYAIAIRLLIGVRFAFEYPPIKRMAVGVACQSHLGIAANCRIWRYALRCPLPLRSRPALPVRGFFSIHSRSRSIASTPCSSFSNRRSPRTSTMPSRRPFSVVISNTGCTGRRNAA